MGSRWATTQAQGPAAVRGLASPMTGITQSGPGGETSPG